MPDVYTLNDLRPAAQRRVPVVRDLKTGGQGLVVGAVGEKQLNEVLGALREREDRAAARVGGELRGSVGALQERVRVLEERHAAMQERQGILEMRIMDLEAAGKGAR